MAVEVADIIDQLVIVQKSITTPGGEKAVDAFDEFPGVVNKFPVFVNAWRGFENVQMQASHRHIDYLIEMQLLFGVPDPKYRERSARTWVLPTLDAFGHKRGLNFTPPPDVFLMHFRDGEHGPIDINGSFYEGITFPIVVRVDEAFEATR